MRSGEVRLAHVVFLRGVNVGGHGRLRPKVLASDLAALEVASVGAAGTFVVGAPVPQDAVEAAFSRRLPFATQVFVATGQDVLALLADPPFPGDAPPDAERHVSVLASPPTKEVRLPLDLPARDWRVRLVAVRPQFACSLWRHGGSSAHYPNRVVETRLGVVATTRTWDTLEAVARVLEAVPR